VNYTTIKNAKNDDDAFQPGAASTRPEFSVALSHAVENSLRNPV